MTPAVHAQKANSRGPGLWMVSLADLVSLLVGFFILCLAGSAAPLGGEHHDADGREGVAADPPGSRLAASVTPPSSLRRPGYLAQILAEHLRNDPLWRHLPIRTKAEYAEISFALDPAATASGQLSFLDRGRLASLAALLSRLDNRIIVVVSLPDAASLPASPAQPSAEVALALAIEGAILLRNGGIGRPVDALGGACHGKDAVSLSVPGALCGALSIFVLDRIGEADG